jgi:hypothetical protein
MAKQTRVRQEHDFLIYGELRGQKTFVVPRGTRDYRLIPELHLTLQEGRALLGFHDPQGRSFLRVLYLDYVGEPDPPWGGREVVQVLLAGGSRVPYRGKKEVPPALPVLYDFLVQRGYGVWYVPFELWGPSGPVALWTPKGAFPLWRPTV